MRRTLWNNRKTWVAIIFSSLSAVFSLGARAAAGYCLPLLLENKLKNLNAVMIIIIIGIGELLLSVAAFKLTELNEISIETDLKSSLNQYVLTAREADLEIINREELTTCFLSDVTIIIKAFHRFVSIVIPDCIHLVVTLSILFMISPVVGATAFFCSLAASGIGVLLGRSISHLHDQYQEAVVKIHKTMTKSTYHIETVRAYGLEDGLAREMEREQKLLIEKKKKFEKVTFAMNIPGLALSVLTYISILIVMAVQIASGNAEFRFLFIVIFLLDYIVDPINRIDGTIVDMKKGRGSYTRFNRFLYSEKKKELLEKNCVYEEIQVIEIKNLSISYPTGTKIIYPDMAFHKGKINFLSGVNGIGKTTLFKILKGIYSPETGIMFVNGSPVLSIDCLKGAISVSIQDLTFFSGTVRENLKVGKNTCSDERMFQLCIEFDIYKSIIGLKDKFDTQINEVGDNLSNGQRQRLNIVRALMSSADIYLFDEPTTFLDYQHRQLVWKKLKELAAEKMVIVATHDKVGGSNEAE